MNSEGHTASLPERLRVMTCRYAYESETEAAKRRISEALLAADRIEELEASNAGLIAALEFIRDGYANQNVNHVDYRVKVYEVALAALSQARPKAEGGARG